MLHRFTLALTVVVALALLGLQTPVTAQQGSYLPGGPNPSTAPNPSITLLNANTWAVGSTRTVAYAWSVCEELLVDVYVGSVFWQLTVRYGNICYGSCAPGPNWGNCKPPKAAWNYLVASPFTVEFLDTSTTSTRVMPTRQNAPTNYALEAMLLVIPQALDRTLATANMKMNFKIYPRETSLIVWTSTDLYCSVPYDADLWRTVERSFAYIGAHRAHGMRLIQRMNEWPNDNYKMWFYYRRTPPIPPHMFKLRHGSSGCTCCCGWGPCGCCVPWNKYYTFSTYTYNWKVLNWGCTYSTCVYSCADGCGGSSLLVWEFYEDKRIHSSTISLNHMTLLAAQAGAAGAVPTLYSLAGEYNMQIRVQWMNLTMNSSRLNNWQVIAAQKKYLAMWIIPPFAIQDLFIKAFDNVGNRLFLEAERHVPYRDVGTGPGNIGYHYAINDQSNFQPIKWTILYNRRARIGTRQEDIRVELLRKFVTDFDGDVTTNIIAPIPTTMVSEPGILGALAKNALTTNALIGRVPYQACLTSNSSLWWYDEKIDFKMNRTKFHTVFYNKTANYYREYLSMTLLMITMAASEVDRSTVFWVMLDAFYPEKPKMIPHFWDPVQLQRLFGHTELITFMNYELGNWTLEHTYLSQSWDWFAADVTLIRWQYLRAHVRRGTVVFEGTTVLCPYVHLMRHSTTAAPNVNLNFEWSTEELRLTAKSNLAANQELYPDFGASNYYKHEFLMNFGGVPPTAQDAATVPGYDGYLDYTDQSRQDLVNRWKVVYSETYKQALARLLSALSVKAANLPLVIDGLGSSADEVSLATAILVSERNVINTQIANGNVEYAMLP